MKKSFWFKPSLLTDVVIISDSAFSIDLFRTSTFGNNAVPKINRELKNFPSIFNLSVFFKSSSKKWLNDLNYISIENFFLFPIRLHD